jgi:hypothetical protein
MEWLLDAVAELPRPLTGEVCDGLIALLTGGTHDDDIALLAVHHEGDQGG